MEPFGTLEGVVAPLDRANVDTDAIIPKQFLKSIKRTGFGKNHVRVFGAHPEATVTALASADPARAAPPGSAPHPPSPHTRSQDTETVISWPMTKRNSTRWVESGP